jgi:hypothetical protein
MKIGIFPGSFKPPHKGHFQLVKDAIKKDKLHKVVIIISKYPRYLDDKIQNAKDYSKTDLEAHFGKSFLTKSAALTYIQSIKPKSRVIDAICSKKIWEIYLSTFKIEFEVKIGFFFSPMINSNVYLKKEVTKGENKFYLYKSSKDETNRRFDFIEKKYGKEKEKTVTFKIMKLKYNINGRDFRNAILQKNTIKSYLPKLNSIQLKKIEEILFST